MGELKPDGETINGATFEDKVVQWSSRKFPGDEVIAGALMHTPEIAEHDKGCPNSERIKGEVDALVLSRVHDGVGAADGGDGETVIT